MIMLRTVYKMIDAGTNVHIIIKVHKTMCTLKNTTMLAIPSIFLYINPIICIRHPLYNFKDGLLQRDIW